jgi:hypothetical protein
MIFRYANLKVNFTLLLSLYNRLKNSRLASPQELEALQRAIDIMSEKLSVIEQELKEE